MISKDEIDRITKCYIGKKCIKCKKGYYKGIQIIGMQFIICDNCGKNINKK